MPLVEPFSPVFQYVSAATFRNWTTNLCRHCQSSSTGLRYILFVCIRSGQPEESNSTPIDVPDGVGFGTAE